MGRLFVLGTLLAAATAMTAQLRSETRAPSPYAIMTGRAVKALSENEIADLKAGRGMGLALAAELNGYPGPGHALELADALALNEGQRAKTQALLDAMRTEAIAIGDQIIAEETRLDSRFLGRNVDRNSLAAATARIGVLQGALRAAHLNAHLAMIDILSPAQTARYTELRGYKAGGHGEHKAE